MRNFFLLVAVAVAGMMQAQTVTLDPAHPTNPNALEFDANGVWTETYNEEDYFTIDCLGTKRLSVLPTGCLLLKALQLCLLELRIGRGQVCIIQ